MPANGRSGDSSLKRTVDARNMSPALIRRGVVKAGALVGGTALAAPWLLSPRARAQGEDLEAYEKADIDWRQAEGETISCAIISAGYFDNLIAVTPAFER